MRDDVPRKPVVYLLVILPVQIIGALCVIIALLKAYSSLRGVPLSRLPGVNTKLITLPALFLWFPVGLMLANVILYCVPPLRRIAERYASENQRPSFIESQKSLLMVFGVIAVVCVPLIVLGFML